MERQLKQRVVGAALLVAFGVIFIPIFLDNDAVQTAVPPAVDIPPAPDDIASTALPLDEPTIEALTAGIETLPAAPEASAAVPPAATTATAPGAVAEQAPESPTPSIAAASPLAEVPDNDSAVGTATMTAPADDEAADRAGRADRADRVGTESGRGKAAASSNDGTATLSGWAIQLGSFVSEDNARRLLDKLRAAGYTAYLERHREGTSTVFKVRVGPERQRADAERLRDRLEREFASKGILRPYR